MHRNTIDPSKLSPSDNPPTSYSSPEPYWWFRHGLVLQFYDLLPGLSTVTVRLGSQINYSHSTELTLLV